MRTVLDSIVISGSTDIGCTTSATRVSHVYRCLTLVINPVLQPRLVFSYLLHGVRIEVETPRVSLQNISTVTLPPRLKFERF